MNSKTVSFSSVNDGSAQTPGVLKTVEAKKRTTISDRTEKFIDCINHATVLFDKVYDALVAMYGERGEEIMETKYSSAHHAMQDCIHHFFMASIMDNMVKQNSTEI
jgi:hypothetical protein